MYNLYFTVGFLLCHSLPTPSPVTLYESSALHIVVVIHWCYWNVPSCACTAAADHSNPSTIRVGLSLLFEFKGVCLEEGIRGIFPLYLYTDHLAVLDYLHVHRAEAQSQCI